VEAASLPYARRMSPSGTAAVLDAALSDRPDVASHLADLERAAWSSVDPVVLELCRVRIAMLLGCADEAQARSGEAIARGLDETTLADLPKWPTSSRFGPRERACLAFCEQFVIDVAGMSDDLAFAVAEHLGPQGLADFTAALLVVEQRQRLRLAWERLLEPVGGA
jgi:alkylhydroperoxidase family enzyme